MAVHSDRAYAAARRQRKTPTSAEKALWALIRDRQVAGLRFRRQVPLGPYVADFCSPAVKLVIEADGGVHVLREAEDAVRDSWLRTQRFVILRFSNETILGKPNTVLDAIRTHAHGAGEHTPPSVSLREPPSPARGEGRERVD